MLHTTTCGRFRLVIATILWAAAAALAAPAAEIQVPNAEFKEGTDGPAGWQLSGGQGRWIDRSVLEVTGTGSGSNQWQSGPLEFTPGSLYRFQMRARQASGSGGCVVSGPSFANRDYHGMGAEWKDYGHVFRVPDNVGAGILRLGQWEAKATVQFDSVRLVPVLPVHRQLGDVILGEGEMVRDGRYTFSGTFGHPGSNFHRTLVSATAAFNSDRWCLSGEGQVTYRFGLPKQQFRAADVSFTVNWHSRGGCLAEVSRDGKTWRALATQKGLGTASAPLPADLLPAEAICLRLRPSSPDGSFQVNRIDFRATLSNPAPAAIGQTVFADVQPGGAQAWVESVAFDENAEPGYTEFQVLVRNPRAQSVPVALHGKASGPRGGQVESPMLNGAAIPAGEKQSLRQAFQLPWPGQHLVELTLSEEVAPRQLKTLATLKVPYTVPQFYDASYGAMIQGTGIWWTDATRKIPLRRAAPRHAETKEARLEAARNDREAVQIVVRHEEALKGLTASAGPLAGPSGAAIPTENIKVLRVFYHFVEHPTDSTGVRDWWPDALPLLDKPIDVPAGQNQPLWVLVHVPKDAMAGDYSGTISLKAEGFSADVPLKLHVWDFALPERNHLETAFGLSPGTIFQYHQLKTDEDKRKVLDLYFQSFAEHRISPYDPTPLDDFRVKFLPEARPPRAEIDFAAFDRAMTAAVEKYRFTNFRLSIEGMGGGTFHERHEPAIGSFGEKTPEYQAMFASQVRQLEAHLRGRGWLDMAYVYWFDEPDPKDYAFVRSGMERLKKYAPGIRRMLTEEPQEALAGAVDIWCPVSFNYHHEAAEKRRAQGEQFWWYVCCGPKAPFCTLFIDHPATELRVWHWQTWQRRITGTLVWSSNYWTSSAAYPDKPQNPYEDPMGYVSGYSTPRGTKVFWGNGDGRFIYPPERAAVPGHSGPGPVLDPPVSSIRWEMLREGVEDYEYLWLLRERLAKKRGAMAPEQVKQIESLLEVPASITKDMTTFTTDPAPIYARRAEIAQAIERLSR